MSYVIASQMPNSLKKEALSFYLNLTVANQTVNVFENFVFINGHCPLFLFYEQISLIIRRSCVVVNYQYGFVQLQLTIDFEGSWIYYSDYTRITRMADRYGIKLNDLN